MTSRTRLVAMVAFADAQLLDIAGPLEVFAVAARLARPDSRRGVPPYRVEILARQAGPLTMSSGLAVVAERGFADVRGAIDTLMVAGGIGTTAALADRQLLAFLRRQAPRVRRLASVCSGTFLLAEAGLLDGKRATTHWGAAARLAARYPRVTVDAEPIFIRQGRIYTSAGVTAGMDLALALVEEDHGPQLARAVARQLVLFLQRPGGQSQFSAQLALQQCDRAPLCELQAWMADHLRDDLSVAALARRVAMSPRNFARVFTAAVGLTPARCVERLRLEAARRRLEESRDGVETIAEDCGFGSAESLRRVFTRTLHVAPSAYRGRFAERHTQ